MCGIIGYAGDKRTSDILVEGLTKLEYRGYDSAGIAVMTDSGIEVRKCKGRIKNLESVLEEEGGLDGFCGVGHTRWATHGEPSDINSHPHVGKRIALVHNGIVENYMALRHMLEGHGYVFESQTDTEVAAKLVDYYFDNDPIEAIARAVDKIRGSFALAIIFAGFEGRVYAARRGNPIIAGLGKNENFVASDIPAILRYTREYYILDENEIAAVTSEGVTVCDLEGSPVAKETHVAEWDMEAAEKGGYPHFMLKEIMEQPRALRDTVSPRVHNGHISFEDASVMDRLAGSGRIFIAACGTAMHAGMVGKHLIERLARMPVEVDIASEFRYRNPIIGLSDSVIIISQSGETADTLAALRLAKSRGAFVLGVVNVVSSSIAREADSVIYTAAGPEIAVASTKAYTVQLAVMTMLAIALAERKGTVSCEEAEALTGELTAMPAYLDKLCADTSHCQYVASTYQSVHNMFYIGRDLDYALSLESALKLKEISYIHSEAYAAGELKHGTISLIEDGTPVIAVATQDGLFEKTASNIREVKARGARVLLVCKEGREDMEGLYDDVIFLPPVSDVLSPIAAILPMQLMAYYTSVLRGCDVDKPRNLAKSVTVE